MIADRRGVSEVLSFALVFAIITSSVALVYVFGFPGLENQRDGERVQNAVRAFDILADNMADIYRRGAPSRATEIKLSEAQLAVPDQVQVNVTVNNSTDTIGSAAAFYRPIVYQSDSGTVVYENGAVIRSDENAGTIMKREPAMLFGEQRTVIPYVQTRSRNVQSVGSDSTVLVRAVRAETEVPFALEDGDSPYYVTLNVTTAPERTDVWEQYFEDQLDWESDPCSVAGGATVTCEFETDEIYVSVTRIDLTLEN